MRVKLLKTVSGKDLAEALMEAASSFEESLKVTETAKYRLEPGSVKKVLDTLYLSLTWRERGLTRGRLDFLLRREPHEIRTGYGYSLRCSKIETDETYKELNITAVAFIPSRSTLPAAIITPDNAKRPQDIKAADELLDKFVGALFKNLGLIDEAPQGA